MPLDPATLREIQDATFRYRWKGVQVIKSPFELSLYPLVLGKLRPRTVIEIGSHKGGSALWLRDMATALGIECEVHSVDIRPPDLRAPGITFHAGNAVAPLPAPLLSDLGKPWLVIEDSAHDYDTTLRCLRFFDGWLDVGDYLVVEDGIVNALGRREEFRGGPLRAIEQFLKETGADYRVDREIVDFWGPGLTWNPEGYMERVACTSR